VLPAHHRGKRESARAQASARAAAARNKTSCQPMCWCDDDGVVMTDGFWILVIT